MRIVGIPPALAAGDSVQLTAEALLANGATRSCEAPAWTVSDPAVASVSATGTLSGLLAGYVTVLLQCEGRSATADTKVDVLSPYQLIIVAQDAEVPTEVGIDATMQFLDGPRAGEIVRVGSVFTHGVDNVRWPVKVRFEAESYEPKEFVLSEATGARRNRLSPLFDFRVPLTFQPDGTTDTYVRKMTREESEIAHPFAVRAPGQVRVRTWWSVDYNDRLIVELWCGEILLRTATQLFGSAGGGFTQEVGTAGSCQVRLRQSKTDAHTHYRVAISYPR